MRAPDRRQDQAALERLREHEVALSRRLEVARAEAEEVRALAREQAESFRREGRAGIEREVAAATAAAAGALEAELESRRDESTRAVAEVRVRAARGREAAVTHLVDAASGGAP
jgi:hypothetical protein